jgi:antitoxin component YwqK of YwqJK toxin-antitoxin module
MDCDKLKRRKILMIVSSNKGYETREDKPSENWYKDGRIVYVVDETTTEGKSLSEKIQANTHNGNSNYDMVINNGELVDVTPYNPISVQTQTNPNLGENQIYADGTDTATITATVDDPNSTEVINFYINGELVSSESAVNGVETLQVNSTQTGDILVEAESSTKYGRNSVTIKAV